MSLVKDFNEYREQMNDKMLSAPNNKILKRIMGVDTIAYKDGALDSKTKEMLGLATSMVLKCNDCVFYHLEKCYELGVSKDEIIEIFGIANLVGGTIVIPHTRKALEYWEDLENSK
ncbi:MAG: carboxymuconolactone decarboxylase family protein [Hyphomicrobiales bacterium]